MRPRDKHLHREEEEEEEEEEDEERLLQVQESSHGRLDVLKHRLAPLRINSIRRRSSLRTLRSEATFKNGGQFRPVARGSRPDVLSLLSRLEDQCQKRQHAPPKPRSRPQCNLISVADLQTAEEKLRRSDFTSASSSRFLLCCHFC
ncbi:unnamed protein product [Pleuronectes platessa]|uniref:Uncharacterized protein n=1 Tax=Pleuronectes platessa TaxID=8262 RepID=A0A9N7UTA6_PLEPL|nr:unnamed protein product [Pleuronectes platessa]